MAEPSILHLHASNPSLLKSSGSQVLGSSDSLSVPSAPPAIENWFSSYVYESPELNTSDDTRGSEDRKEAFDVEGRDKENEENLGEFRRIGESDELIDDGSIALNGFTKCKNSLEDDKFANKDLSCSDSLALSSAPPDVKNWFSSYVYESLTFNTSEDLGLSLHEESKFNEEEDDGKKNKKEEEKDFNECRITGKTNDLGGLKLAPSVFVKCNGSKNNNYEHQHAFKGNNGVDGNTSTFVPNNLPSENISEQIFEVKREEYCYNNGLTNDIEVSISKNKDSISTANIYMNLSKEDTGNCGKNNKENHETDFSENGFVSTRKSRSRRRITSENSLKMPFVGEHESLEKGAIITRNVLQERTNFQNSGWSETAGKWRCPQKSKPNRGPPLKQLRLEQWVRRG